MTCFLDLVVSIAPIRCTACEPRVYTGWRLDRGSQRSDKPVFICHPPPVALRVPAKPLSSVVDLEALRRKSNVEEVQDEESARVDQSKQACRKLYATWRDSVGDRDFTRVRLPVDASDVQIENVAVLISLYGTWAAPSDHGNVVRLVERRIDQCSISLGAVFGQGRPQVCTMLAFRYKLAIAIDLTRSEWIAPSGERTTLEKLGSQLPAARLEVFAGSMRKAFDWSLRMARLANVQSHTMHPTRRYMNAEQTHRKFNGSYFVSPLGDPHPGMRWVSLQCQNLTVLDAPTVLEWLRIVMLTEQIDYLPAECKSPAHARVTASRLLALMAVVPARMTTYMSDCVDRCDPALDVFEPPLRAGPLSCAPARARRPALHSPATAAAHRGIHPASGHHGAHQPASGHHGARQPSESRVFHRTKFIAQPDRPVVRVQMPRQAQRDEVVQSLFRSQSSFAGARRKVGETPRQSLMLSSHCGALLSSSRPARECRTRSANLSLFCSDPACVRESDRHGCYHVMAPADGNCLLRELQADCRPDHVTEKTDEYDGVLDNMHSGITCNDCETQSFYTYRCAQSLRDFFHSGAPPPSATELEGAWMKAITQAQRERDWQIVSVFCTISMSAMEDGGKRGGTSLRAKCAIRKEEFQANLELERKAEANCVMHAMAPLVHSGDGSTWSYWPRAVNEQLDGDSDAEDTLTANEPAAGMYDGQRTDHSPDLGCHVCSIVLPWRVLFQLAARGIMVEQRVQETCKPLTSEDVKQLMADWRLKPNIEQQTHLLDPAALLLEATENSHCQQSGDEVDGLGRSLMDDTFFRFFEKTFGPYSSVFVQRLPLSMTKGYDMYYSKMEISCHRLFKTFGCGNWTFYSMSSGRHGIDFRTLFGMSVHEAMYGKRGLDVCLRPTTPLLPRDEIKKLVRRLWPVERMMPFAPQLGSVTNVCDSTDLPHVRVETRPREHVLFINPVYWEMTPQTKSVREMFQDWAQRNNITFTTERVHVHQFLSLIVLRCIK